MKSKEPHHNSTSGEFFKHLRSFIADPKGVSSIAPSSSFLAKLLISEITVSTGLVIELGPGTGRITRELLAAGIDANHLALIEKNELLANELKEQFPQAHVFQVDAKQLASIALFNNQKAGACISSLPMVVINEADISAILKAVLTHMREDAAFYQYAYWPVCPIPKQVLSDLNLSAKRIGATWLNIPPAWVFKITRQPTHS